MAVVRTGGRQRRPLACAFRNSTDWNFGNASSVLTSGWNCIIVTRNNITLKAKFGLGQKAAAVREAHIPPSCTHRVPPLAPSWWCFHHWVPIHRTLRRNYRTGYHHWHQNTPQLSLPQKEALGMNYSQLKAGRGGKRNCEEADLQKRPWARWQVGRWAHLGWLGAVVNLPGFLQLLPLLGQTFVHRFQGSEHCWAGKGSVNIRSECEFPTLPFPLTSQGDGADVLLDFLALRGQCGCRKRQLGVDVVRDGGGRGAQVRVTKVAGGELQHNLSVNCFNFHKICYVRSHFSWHPSFSIIAARANWDRPKLPDPSYTQP